MTTLLAELYIDDAWTDITADVYVRDSVVITHGQNDEGSSAAPAKLDLTLNNRDGRYSPRNPISPYYGKIGRNTPIRVTVPVDPVSDTHSGTTGTGDLSWTHTPADDPSGVAVFVWQYGTSGGQIDSVTYGGVAMTRHIFGLFTMGGSTAVGYMYFLGKGVPPGPQTVAVDTNAVNLRQASAISVAGGTESELAGTANAYSNATPSANPSTTLTVTYRSQLFASLLSDLDDGSSISAGLGWTEISEVDLGTETVNVERSFPQAPGNYSVRWNANLAHWGIMAIAIRTTYHRFTGEVSSFPPKWELSGKDAWMPIEASGIVRRLNQGRNPNSTGLFDYIIAGTPYTYWPLTDGSSSLSGAAYGAYAHYRYRGELLASAEFGAGELDNTLSNVLKITDTGDHPGTDGYFYGFTSTPTGGAIALDFVWRAEVLGPLDMGFWINRETGQWDKWSLNFRADGSNDDIELKLYLDTNGDAPSIVSLANSDALDAVTDGAVHHCRIMLTENGTGTDYDVYVDGDLVISGTRATYAVRDAAMVTTDYRPDGVNDTPLSLGHVVVWSAIWGMPDVVDMAYAVTSYLGEPAGERIARLCEDNSITLQSRGDLGDTYTMGRQSSGALLPIIEEAVAVDMGILFEPRDELGLAYRTRKDLYNQSPRVTLDYSAGEIAPPFDPVDDDQRTRNDIFAQRVNGGSYQATLLSGPLSIIEPPGGVGRYKDEAPLNVESDDALPEIAGWLLMLGTIDEARFPSLTVNMAVLSAAQQAAVLSVSVGDRVVVTEAEAANLYDDLSLLVIGYKEDIGPVEHIWTAVCVPYSPYEVLQLDDSTSRLSPGEAYHLAADVTSTATALSVEHDIIEGVEGWTTDAGQMPMPIMVGGEEMTVTAVTGAGNPQSFTVTRSVNGVVKPHDADTIVRLARRARLAL